jgi:hypothetical protein
MFISPAEKDAIRTSINLLQERVANLEVALNSIGRTPAKPAKPAKQKRNWSPEQRAAASVRMRERHEAKRAAQ